MKLISFDSQLERSDHMFKHILRKILYEGSMDINPRPKYADGTPAHTLSINGVVMKYDLSKGEFPLISLRPIAYKSAIKEILWIYQDQTSDLNVLRDKYGVTWWDEWAVPDPVSPNGLMKTCSTIGSCYGHTVKRYDMMNKILEGLKNDPDSRRHIINLWQEEEFKEPHGLKPCALYTQYIVRHSKDEATGKIIDYLDAILMLRSSDFIMAGTINAVQYAVLMCLVARHCSYEPGELTVMYNNCQIYDRHVDAAKEMLNNRETVHGFPKVILNPEKTNFYDFTMDDITIQGYPLLAIKNVNPQFNLDIGI